MIQSQCSTSTSSVGFDAVDLPEIFSPSIPSTSNVAPSSSSSSTPHQPAPKDRVARPTECSICGSPANGYHYDVASCNGCKTFFRRVCLSEKSFQCKLNSDCFDLTKRKKPLKCRACRHQKCIRRDESAGNGGG
ncbi:unnamed protein product [Caenorhabditis brenneri]